MKYFIAVVVFSLTAVSVFSQSNFVEGYILVDPHDTIHGLIDDRNYFENSTHCDFKDSEFSAVRSYFPENIYGYRINNGKFYITKSIKTDGKDSLYFMEYLIDGELDVFFRQDEMNRNHYYVSKNSGTLYELHYGTKIININNKVYEKVNKTYIGVLKNITQDSPGFSKQLNRAPNPGHKNMIKLAKDYHNSICKDRECIVYSKPSALKLYFEIITGIAAGTTKFDEYRRADKAFYGFNIFLNNPEYNERWFIGLGYLYEGKYGERHFDVEGKLQYIDYYKQHRVPLTVGYFPNMDGLVPTFQGSVNILFFNEFIEPAISVAPGLKYSFGSFYIRTFAEAQMILLPVRFFAVNIGLNMGYSFGH